ncbi:ubiquinol-cytochrome-c reductase complex assembly factor 6 [Musca vetustissima]|uniref:ubiquinol-cytochrome-c reductase complex assembly factor 6 n=1 Tax=Musca vetustissima TaxID=27455 RepID=UPI002AB624E0|nr:ubiquinol-cytochrome-c reductase complex assembly factor 6 [Musca vetustissima]
MPAGVSWGQYLKFMSCAVLSMMAGSQLVHMYYKPLQDLDVYIDKEVEEVSKTKGVKLTGISIKKSDNNSNAT